MAKMTPIEKLAREICWAGFVHLDSRKGKTKAGYWRSIHEDAREKYISDAKWFAFIVKRVSVDVLNELN